jgi:integrase
MKKDIDQENDLKGIYKRNRAKERLSDKEIRGWITAWTKFREDPSNPNLGQPKQKKFDGGGLHLFMTHSGFASWRVRYSANGKEKTYTIGGYPDVSLAAARIELSVINPIIKQGKDPLVERKINRAINLAKVGDTFKSVAEDWLLLRKKEWSQVHYKKSSDAFKRDVYPEIGSLPISSVTPLLLAKNLEKILKRDIPDTASRILQHINGVFNFAQAKGLCTHNPASAAREVLPRKKTNKKYKALLEWHELGDLLRRAEKAPLSPQVRMAHRLLAFTAASRISNIVEATWEQFNLDDLQPVWIIPRENMKLKTRDYDHRIPLCSQIVGELKDWKRDFGSKGYLFPSSKKGKNHITIDSIEKAYRITLGLRGKHQPHGWRSSLSTLAKEKGFDTDAVELALDHTIGSKSSQRYDRGERFNERIEIYDWWGKQLQVAQYPDIKKL